MRCFTRVHLVVLAAGLVVVLALAGCGDGDDSTESNADNAVQIAAAMDAYVQAANAGKDLKDGPCLSQHLPGSPDWVADVAHDPREDVDDDPANQCQSYIDGEAQHFVELTPKGQLIRAE